MRSFTKPLRLTALFLAGYAILMATGCQKQATEKQANSNGGPPGALSKNNGNGWGNISPKTIVNVNDFYRGVYIFQLRDKSGKVIDSGKFQVAH